MASASPSGVLKRLKAPTRSSGKDSEQAASDEFREMYATPEGRALLEQRPALVSETTVENYTSFDD